jgi:GNAT superfamily N-acetyltransferase
MPAALNASVDIVRAAPDRLAPLSALIGRAFVNEPMMLWPLGTQGDVKRRLIRAFELFNEPLAHQGMLWEAPTARGAAVWIPAAAGEAYDHALETSREQMHALTDDGGRRWDCFWEWVEANLATEPVWHLDSVAVDTPWRGTGIGGALVRFGLERARADGTPAFLETGNPRNVPYYQHLGFEIVADLDAPNGGPHVWFMRWDDRRIGRSRRPDTAGA